MSVKRGCLVRRTDSRAENLISILVSKNLHEDLTLNCNLSFFDNLPEAASERSNEENVLVTRTIRLLNNILRDVIRTWQAKGGDVSEFSHIIRKAVENPERNEEGRVYCGKYGVVKLRSRKAPNYAEAVFAAELREMEAGMANNRVQTAKRKAKQLHELGISGWIPQIVLDVNREGDSWDYQTKRAREDTETLKEVRDSGVVMNAPDSGSPNLNSFSYSGPSLDDALPSSLMDDTLLHGDLFDDHNNDESCWLRLPLEANELQCGGLDAFDEIQSHIPRLQAMNPANKSVASRADIGVGDDRLQHSSPRSGRSDTDADVDEVATKWLTRMVRALYRIKSSAANDDDEADEETVTGMQCKSTSTADDSARKDMLQILGRLSAQLGSTSQDSSGGFSGSPSPGEVSECLQAV